MPAFAYDICAQLDAQRRGSPRVVSPVGTNDEELICHTNFLSTLRLSFLLREDPLSELVFSQWDRTGAALSPIPPHFHLRHTEL